jgi:hypothetical protein
LTSSPSDQPGRSLASTNIIKGIIMLATYT